jgi:hypothetical protein
MDSKVITYRLDVQGLICVVGAWIFFFGTVLRLAVGTTGERESTL